MGGIVADLETLPAHRSIFNKGQWISKLGEYDFGRISLPADLRRYRGSFQLIGFSIHEWLSISGDHNCVSVVSTKQEK